MKQFIYLAAFALMTVSASAQQDSPTVETSIDKLVATVKSSNVQISWLSNKTESNYWEVQASADGQNFSTIGLVMGANPKGSKGEFCFKQQTNKLKTGLKYFRVVYIETPEQGVASSSIRLTK